MTNVLLSVGSNRSLPETQVRSACHELDLNFSGVQISSLYLTEPSGPVVQDSFVNAAITLKTELTTSELLKYLLQMELRAGRDRELETAKGPRNLDLDIILFGNEIHLGPELSIPHPRFRERRFVLQPATEIASIMQDPISQKNIGQLFAECDDTNWVSLMKNEALAI